MKSCHLLLLCQISLMLCPLAFYKTWRRFSLLWCNLWLLKFLMEKKQTKRISLRQKLSEVGASNEAWALKQLETLLSDCCICRTGSCFNVHRHTSTVAVKGLLKMSKVDCCALKWARFSLAAQSEPVRTSARASLILLLLRLLFQLNALKRATHLFYFVFVPCNDCFSVLGCLVT